MKTRRIVTLCALLATLMVSSISSIAEEGGRGVITSLSTTLSGYVDSSVNWQVQPIRDTPTREHKGWWRKFFHWLGFHGWR